jgi:hypothetical protein
VIRPTSSLSDRKSLAKADKLQRDQRKAAAMRDDEWITIPTASAGDAQAASGTAA